MTHITMSVRFKVERHERGGGGFAGWWSRLDARGHWDYVDHRALAKNFQADRERKGFSVYNPDKSDEGCDRRDVEESTPLFQDWPAGYHYPRDKLKFKDTNGTECHVNPDSEGRPRCLPNWEYHWLNSLAHSKRTGGHVLQLTDTKGSLGSGQKKETEHAQGWQVHLERKKVNGSPGQGGHAPSAGHDVTVDRGAKGDGTVNRQDER